MFVNAVSGFCAVELFQEIVIKIYILNVLIKKIVNLICYAFTYGISYQCDCFKQNLDHVDIKSLKIYEIIVYIYYLFNLQNICLSMYLNYRIKILIIYDLNNTFSC